MSHEPDNNSDLPQNIVNKVVETAIASQVKSAGKIDVNLNSEVFQALQGKANSLKIIGEKVIAFKDIQLEEIDIACQDLSLNLTQALLGNIAFDQPGNFQIKLVFTESDCDRLLNSAYVRTLLQNLALEIDRQPANFYLQQSKCHLKQEGNLSLEGIIILNREQQLKTAPFKIAFLFYQAGLEIGFGGGKYLENQTLDLNETVAIMNKVQNLLYLRNFENDDLAFDITNIQIKQQQLIIQANTEIKRLPDSISQSIKSVSSEINN